MSRALSIVLNSFKHDSRVQRQLTTLGRQGFDTVLFALPGSGLATEEHYGLYRVQRMRLGAQTWRAHALLRLLGYAECLLQMVWAGVRMKPILIHANDLSGLPIAYLIARMTGAKFIYDSHELWSDPDYPTYQHFPRLIFQLAVGLERFLAHRADAVITVSDGIAECMSRNIGISKPLVIRNLPNRSEIACRHREHRLHEALGLEAQIPVILHLGALDRDRGIEMLLSALPFVAPPAVAVCLGSVESESYLQSLQRRARELGIEERIYFRESVPAHDVCAYASGAAVGVSLLWCNRLNNRFALPNKLFEYLQASLPVVVNGPSERQALVDTYDVGESFTDGNVMALAEALNIMLTDEKRVERYRVNALRAARELNWEKEELRLMQIYRRLAPNTHCLNADPALEVK